MKNNHQDIELIDRRNSYEINFNQEEEKVIENEDILKQTEILEQEAEELPIIPKKQHLISKKMKQFCFALFLILVFFALNVSLLVLSKAKSSFYPANVPHSGKNSSNITNGSDTSNKNQTDNQEKSNKTDDSSNKTEKEDILYPRKLFFIINQSNFTNSSEKQGEKQSRFIESLKVSIYFENYDEFNIKITDADPEAIRFALPEKYPFPYTKFYYDPNEEFIKTNYTIEFDSNTNFSLKIRRKITKELIFDTSPIEFLYTDRFIEFGAKLPSYFLFGLGERKSGFLITPGVYTIWNRNAVNELDTGTPGHQSSGTHPVYLMKENSGNFHMMLLKNVDGMQYEFNAQDELKFKIIGGIIDLKFFIGDKYPENVIKKYHAYINNFNMMPFWAFGIHQAIIGDFNSSKINSIIEKYKENGLPLDALWSDIELMKKCNKSNNSTVFDLINNLKGKLHFVNEIRLGIPIETSNEFFEDAMKKDILIKSAKTKKPLVACQCSDKIVYPDFNHPNISKYWSNLLSQYYQKANFDGIALTYNEPTLSKDFEGELVNLETSCPLSLQNSSDQIINLFENFTGWIAENVSPITQSSLPFLPQNIEKETLSLDSYHYNQSDYFSLPELRELDYHNLNGFMSAFYTSQILKEILNITKPFVSTKSTIFGAGNFATQWSGETLFSWSFLKVSITSLFKASLFGLPFSGSDVCSFSNDFNSELCARWLQLGTFYPLARLRISENEADKGVFSFNESYVMSAARESFSMRYSLLKYLFSLYEEKNGVGVVFQPLFFEFPEEETLYEVEDQFMMGKNLMVTPLMEQKLEVVSVYFPMNVKWVNFKTGEIFLNKQGFKQDVISKINESCPIFVKEGSIIHYQNSENITKTNDLDNHFRLFAMMKSTSHDEYEAEGNILAISDYNDQKKLDNCRKNKEKNICFLKIILKVSIMGPPDYLVSVSIEAQPEKNTEIDDNLYLDGVDLFGLQIKEKFSNKTVVFDPKVKIEKNLAKTFINT